MPRCSICGRPLKDPESVRLGIGPDCRAIDNKRRDVPYTDRHDPTMLDAERCDITFHRGEDGMLTFNIPRRHVHHSPSGWEWGYGGSGPADFALNILAVFESEMDDVTPKQRIACWDGSRAHPEVWRLHEEFKRDVVAHLPREGGVLWGAGIRRWLSRRTALHAQPSSG